MKVVFFHASPKKDGKIGQIIQEMESEAQKSKIETQLLFLSDLKLQECTSCGKCIENKKCIIRDDIMQIEDAILQSDVMIFGTPTHWGNTSSILLKVFERLVGFVIQQNGNKPPIAFNAKGKNAVLIAACSTPSPFNWIFNQSRSAISRMNEFCRYSGIKVIKKMVLPGTRRFSDIPNNIKAQSRKILRSVL